MVKLEWPNLYFKPINLWNVPYMNASQVIELANALENTAQFCNKECKVDVFKEKCITCNRTLEQIEKNINE